MSDLLPSGEAESRQGSSAKTQFRPRPTAEGALPASAASWVGLVGAITIAGLLLRLPSFGDSLFGDELSTYFVVTGRSLGEALSVIDSPQEGTPPLFFLAAWASEHFLDSPQSLRLTSLAAGVAAIPLTYVLGQWTVGRRAALVGSALVCVSPFLVFYSVEARPYSLMLLLGLASTLSLLRALDTRAFGWWAGYAAFSCGAAYTHYTVIFLLLAQFTWALLTYPGMRRALFGANAVAALAYLPWIPGLIADTDAPASRVIGVLYPFGPDTVVRGVSRWIFGHPYVPLTHRADLGIAIPGEPALAIIGGGLILGFLGFALTLRGSEVALRPPPRTALIGLLALATPVGAALFSLVGDSVWLPRNLIGSSPALALAAGAILASGRRMLAVPAIALVTSGLLIGSVKMLDSDHQRPDTRAAAEFIERRGAPDDPVMQVGGLTPGPFMALEPELVPLGEPERPNVLRLTQASRQIQVEAQSPNGQWAPPPPPPPPEEVAENAAILARGGKLFVVLLDDPGAAPPALDDEGPLSRFLSALPARLRHTETEEFPGVSVYMFTDEGGR